MKTEKFLPLLFFFIASFILSQCASINKNISKVEPRTSTASKPGFPEKPEEISKRNKMVQFAEKHLGTKYKYAGKTPKGFDCSGFTYYIAKQFDISINATSSSQESNGKKISVKDVKAGDLIFFRRTKDGEVFHVAMVYSNDKGEIEIIHSTSSRGVVLDKLNRNKYWEPKVSSARDVISE